MNDNDAIKLRPGLLVTLHTRIEGGCAYDREDLGHSVDDVAGELRDVTEWKTTRTIADAEEWDRASKVRSQARALVASACVDTPFSFLLCPTEQETLLDQKLAEAQALVALFNAGSAHSKIKLVSVRGAIAESRVEAITAVKQELNSLIGQLDQAIGAGDVGGIRELVTRAQRVGKMLDQQSDAKGALGKAIAAARVIAKTLVKRVEQQGEAVATVLEEANLSPIAQARFLFIDAPNDGEQTADAGETEERMPGVALGRFAAMGGQASLPEPDQSADGAAAEGGV